MENSSDESDNDLLADDEVTDTEIQFDKEDIGKENFILLKLSKKKKLNIMLLKWLK